MDIGPSEAETFWTEFLRKLRRRGLRGVRLVVSDAHEGIKAAVVESGARSDRVSIGDTVRVRYLTDDKHVVQFTISAERSDPANGVIHYKKPIAEALLGAEEGDEVEILVGSYLRPAVLEKIVSPLH
jgi:hypothetical protein